jgi:hypothetical protein
MTKGKNRNPELVRLDSASLLAGSPLRREDVVIPEIGIVLIQEFTAPQRLAYLKFLEIGDDGLPKFKPEKQVLLSKFILSLGCRNPDGSLMFESMDAIPDLRADVYEIVGTAILQLSGILPKEVADNLPNVKPTPTAPSP